MNIKRAISLLTVGGMLATFAAGCGNSSKSPSGTATPAKTGPVTIVYSRGKDTTKATDTLVADFNKKYAGKIQVKVVYLPNDTDKQHDTYVTCFSSGGTDYDVFDSDVIWPAEFAEAGYSLPLDNYIAKDNVKLSDYMAGPVAAVTFKGKTWGLPRFIDAGMLFYRKDLVSKVPTTWDELDSMSKSLKGKAQYSYICQAKQYEGLVCNAVEFIAAYGGQIVDGNGNITINSDGTKAGLTEMKKILGSNYVPNNITTFTETETDNTFIAGQSIFARNWPYQWADASDATKSKIVGKVAVASLPKGSARAASCLGGWCAMINKNTKHPDEAWTFLKYLAGPEGQKTIATVGGSAPTITSLYNDPDVQKASPLFADPDFVKGLSATVPRPVSPIYKKLSNIMQAEISNYLTNKEDVNTCVSNMDTQMKAAVSSASK